MGRLRQSQIRIPHLPAACLPVALELCNSGFQAFDQIHGKIICTKILNGKAWPLAQATRRLARTGGTRRPRLGALDRQGPVSEAGRSNAGLPARPCSRVSLT